MHQQDWGTLILYMEWEFETKTTEGGNLLRSLENILLHITQKYRRFPFGRYDRDENRLASQKYGMNIGQAVPGLPSDQHPSHVDFV